MSQYWPCIPGKCHKVVILFHNFEARLWKCYYMTIIVHMWLFAKLTQRWWNVIIPASGRRCEFKVVVTKLYRRCRYNIRDMLWGEFFIQRWGNLSPALWIWSCSISVVNLTSWFQPCKKVVNIILIVQRELKFYQLPPVVLFRTYHAKVSV